MKRILPSIVILLGLLLAACGSTPAATPTATAAPTAALTPVPTDQVVGAQPGQCQVATSLFSKSTTSPVPLPVSTDHSKGPENAKILLIEYSDFT